MVHTSYLLQRLCFHDRYNRFFIFFISLYSFINVLPFFFLYRKFHQVYNENCKILYLLVGCTIYNQNKKSVYNIVLQYK